MTTPRPTPTPEEIQGGYGFVALLARAIPELNGILQEAVKGQWTTDHFLQKVADSNWFKTTPATQRDWITKQITDPSSADRELLAGADEVHNIIAEMGLPWVDADRAKEIWLHSKLGMHDETQRRGFIARLALEKGISSDGTPGGQLGQMVNEMFKVAADYGYNSPSVAREIYDQALWSLSRGGQVNSEGWRSRMIDYAAAFYAPYKDDIRGGKTVADIAKPVVDRVAQLLEMTPDAVNLNDPLIRRAMTEFHQDGRAYSLREIEDQTRKDARWKTTDNAFDTAAKFLDEIGTKFGMVAGG